MEVKSMSKLNKFLGSPQIETSQAGKEIVPLPQDGDSPYSFVEFSIMVESDCTVSINDSSPIFLRAGVMDIAKHHADIYSFKILDNGIKYNWMAAL